VTDKLQRDCPCGSGSPYDACCGRLHRGAAEAATAEELMRSRYAAYAVTHADHLFRTWHPRTRPEHVLGTPATSWTGLELLDVVGGGPEDGTGIVEFRAFYRDATGDGVLHERSTFVRRGGRWVYVSPEQSPE
jgi:SEC-C motif-containing protein